MGLQRNWKKQLKVKIKKKIQKQKQNSLCFIKNINLCICER